MCVCVCAHLLLPADGEEFVNVLTELLFDLHVAATPDKLNKVSPKMLSRCLSCVDSCCSNNLHDGGGPAGSFVVSPNNLLLLILVYRAEYGFKKMIFETHCPHEINVWVKCASGLLLQAER